MKSFFLKRVHKADTDIRRCVFSLKFIIRAGHRDCNRDFEEIFEK